MAVTCADTGQGHDREPDPAVEAADAGQEGGGEGKKGDGGSVGTGGGGEATAVHPRVETSALAGQET